MDSPMTLPFSAPGKLTDFQTDQQRQGWSDSVSQLFDDTVAAVTGCVSAGSIQFVNPAKVDTSAYTRSDISWSGFPNSLLAQGGPGNTPLTPTQAFTAADQPGKAGRFTQDEYLEWFIHRDGNGSI